MRRKPKSSKENSDMKSIAGGCAIALLILLVPVTSSSAGELEEHLQFLEPLIGKEWVGGYVGSESPDMQIVLRFEQVLDGRAVRYVREVEAADFSGLTQFYWNPGRAEVCFISLNNRGIVEEGVVKAENGRIVLHGKSHREDKTTEFKTTLEIDANGTLRDTFLRVDGSEWVQGHLQEFVAKE
jgi:hypothetical protein